MIRAQMINLRGPLGVLDRVIARGVVPIDTIEGAPAVIAWQCDTFALCHGRRDEDELDYRQVRVLHAGDVFQAVR
jgi:hypothetical protein